MQRGVEMKPALFTAARDGQVDEVRHLLAAGGDIEERDGSEGSELQGHSPLQIAAYKGRADVVMVLLEHGADISSTNDYGWTPLHLASFASFEETVRILLDKGADLNSKTTAPDGKTPEVLAISRQNLQVVAMLRAEAVRREEVRLAQLLESDQCWAFAMVLAAVLLIALYS